MQTFFDMCPANAHSPCLDAETAQMHHQIDAVLKLPDEFFVKAFEELIDRLENGFRDQETKMEALCDPNIKHHREEHARVLGVLYHAQSIAQRGEYRFARKVAALLQGWLIVHEQTMDQAFASYRQESSPQPLTHRSN